MNTDERKKRDAERKRAERRAKRFPQEAEANEQAAAPDNGLDSVEEVALPDPPPSSDGEEDPADWPRRRKPKQPPEPTEPWVGPQNEDEASAFRQYVQQRGLTTPSPEAARQMFTEWRKNAGLAMVGNDHEIADVVKKTNAWECISPFKRMKRGERQRVEIGTILTDLEERDAADLFKAGAITPTVILDQSSIEAEEKAAKDDVERAMAVGEYLPELRVALLHFRTGGVTLTPESTKEDLQARAVAKAKFLAVYG